MNELLAEQEKLNQIIKDLEIEAEELSIIRKIHPVIRSCNYGATCNNYIWKKHHLK